MLGVHAGNATDRHPGAGGKQDYGDKGLASVEKSTGLPQNAKANEVSRKARKNHVVDPLKQISGRYSNFKSIITDMLRSQMITDKGREGIEGATGKNIPDKVYVAQNPII